STPTQTDELLGRVAAVHRSLLSAACSEGGSALAAGLSSLEEYLDGPASALDKRRLLCHPLLIEGLHGLAACSDTIRGWHDCVAAPSPHSPASRLGVSYSRGENENSGPTSLGNIGLVCALRSNRAWQGEQLLCTDLLGRIGLPFSDWTLILYTNENDFL